MNVGRLVRAFKCRITSYVGAEAQLRDLSYDRGYKDGWEAAMRQENPPEAKIGETPPE